MKSVSRLLFASILSLCLTQFTACSAIEDFSAALQSTTDRSDDGELTETLAVAAGDDESADAQEIRSDAERIAELNEAIELDLQQIQAMERELEDPQNEYALSEAEFRELDRQLDEAKELQEKLIADPASTQAQRSELADDIERYSKQWKLAKDRFDLAIDDRKSMKEQLATLKDKLQEDRSALKMLTDGPEPDKAEDTAEEPTGKNSDSKDEPANSEADSTSTGQQADKDSEDPDMVEESTGEEDAELVRASQEAQEKEDEAEEAELETESIESRLKGLQVLIAQELKELNIAKKKVDLATAAQTELTAELNQLSVENAEVEEINSLKKSIASAGQRLIKSRSEVSEINERLSEHRAQLGSLQAEHIIALREAEQARNEALESAEELAELKNPFTVRNMLQWLFEHGPRLALIIVGMFVVNRVASLLASRSVQLVSRGSVRGSKVERENRARTLVGVFQNAASVAVFISGSLMILEELGANITVLMGGVAVIGLAVAFGAQNLIKDYFYGFVMLLENQYMLNDTVRIGGITGQVERITLRMTVLRDGNGVVHFIPNGTIESVSNETHGWSRAVCEIAVNHDENIERVLELLTEVAEELVNDPSLAALLLEKPSQPSIEGLDGPVIRIKMAVKTAPNKHSTVKQEWLKRIKLSLTHHQVAPPFSDLATRLRRHDQHKAA